MAKITNEEFQRKFKEKYGDEYTLLDDYKNSTTMLRARHNCDYCGGEIRRIHPSNIFKNLKCLVCFGNKDNEKTFKDKLSQINKDIKLIGDFKDKQHKVMVKHKCGYKWEVIPSSLLIGKTGCPKCAGNIKKTREEFQKEVDKKHGVNIYKVLGDYKTRKIKTLVRHNCSKCNDYEWEVSPASLLNSGCPVCSGREAVLGINTIWDTDRWMCDLGVSEEDAKKYKSRSGKRIIVKCPDCGKEKELRIADIYGKESIGCSCSDKKSYPEKFVMAFIDQLEIKYKKEYTPKWIKPKRYDFYIPTLNLIVEVNGRQHYADNTSFKHLGGKNLREQEINDRYKKETALANGIKHYIELDCSKSNLEYVKKSILNSELNSLFDLSKVDWLKCAEFANKNIVKEVCEYWNYGIKNIHQISMETGYSRPTISKYLAEGNDLGWCKFDRTKAKRMSYGGWNSRRIIMLNKDVFIIKESSTAMARYLTAYYKKTFAQSYISLVARGEKDSYNGCKFFYLDNLTEEEKEKYNIPQKLKELEKN